MSTWKYELTFEADDERSAQNELRMRIEDIFDNMDEQPFSAFGSLVEVV